MRKAAQQEEAKRPKRTFNMPGGSNSAFSQMMRAQMGGNSDLGPRKLDSCDKRNYKDMATQQALSNREKAKAVTEREKMRNTNSARPDKGAA